MSSASPVPPLFRVQRHVRPGSARRPRGVVLLLVLVYIVLVMGLLTLITASAAQLFRVDRHERAAMILRQMLDSGHAWAIVHQDDGENTGAVVLDAQQLLPAAASGTVTVTTARDNPSARVTFTIIAQLETSDGALIRSATFECLEPAAAETRIGNGVSVEPSRERLPIRNSSATHGESNG